MGSSDQHPGTTLAQSLLGQSEREASMTPMDAVLDAARQERLTADQCFRLVSRLWTLKRLMYYVYGGWAQGINLNDYPPAVAYLFGKQIYDESTHEMQYLDEILRRRWVRTQRKFFEHPYGQFATASRVSAYIFCLRALANYPQNLRIAALNLGPKVIELAWSERFAQKEVDVQLATRLCAETRRDYLFFLEEGARFVLGLKEETTGEVMVSADID